MSDHLTAAERIDYLHRELDETTDARVQLHLTDCEFCRTEAEYEARLTDLIRACAAQEERELPSEVKAGIWQIIHSQRRPSFISLPGFLRPAISLPLATAAALALWFLLPFSHLAPATVKIDARYFLRAHASDVARGSFSERLVPVNFESVSQAEHRLIRTALLQAVVTDPFDTER
ncbi:MAG TPA: hypothetical protein VGZ00_07695 [Candidatus Baltobacteraceae bacterium]|jgi:anti-sigma factor RsiW|nr:hypothetical protein [Candidatus Baltobacteraceae bacterium]